MISLLFTFPSPLMSRVIPSTSTSQSGRYWNSLVKSLLLTVSSLLISPGLYSLLPQFPWVRAACPDAYWDGVAFKIVLARCDSESYYSLRIGKICTESCQKSIKKPFKVKSKGFDIFNTKSFFLDKESVLLRLLLRFDHSCLKRDVKTNNKQTIFFIKTSFFVFILYVCL